jgi:hypothetical protein
MMKKLLVLMLVLGLASMATAALSITVGGVDIVDSEVTIAPSDTINVGVYANIAGGSEYASYVLVVASAQGTIGQGTATGLGSLSEVKDNAYYGGYYLTKGLTDAGLIGGDWGGGMVGNVSDISGGALVGDAATAPFHCEAFGDAILLLYTSTSGLAGSYSLEDTVIIHQIPEPITMSLLAVGGLFLRRRK